jgi:hypothetical protein
MVLFERAIMELSSLTASVTLEEKRSTHLIPDSETKRENSYIKEFGFFFFLRIAVDVSISCGREVSIH